MWTTGGRTRIADLLTSEEPLTSVTVMAWLRSARVSKGVAFLSVSDGSCMTPLQVVVGAETQMYELAGRLATGAAVRVVGDLTPSPAQGQAWELKATALGELGASEDSYPLQKKRHTFEYLRTIAHLRPRANAYQAVFRVRNALAFAIHRFFQERGFLYVHTPIVTGSDAEGAGEMFSVTTLDIDKLAAGASRKVDYAKDFFGRRTALTVSGQLEAEIFALAFTDVYTFGPTFRAENSNTSRHAAEFWMIEPEIAFADLRDDLRLAEDFMRSITKEVMERCEEDLAFFAKRIDKSVPARLAALTERPYEVLTYTEAVKLLEKADAEFEYPVSFGVDLQSEHERYLTEKVFDRPVFVIDYPKEIKAFYMRLNDDERTVAALDLLVPGVGEIIGGSQREERHDVLLARIEEMGLPADDYWWYLDLRRYGSVKHAGFGLGFERLLMYLTGMGNIRDVIPFPRTPGHAEF